MRFVQIVTLSAVAASCFAQFTPAPNGPFPAGGSPSSVAVADFNNDGIQDLAIADVGSGTVTVMLGDAMGGFGSPVSFPAGKQPASIAVFYTMGCGSTVPCVTTTPCATPNPCASLAIANEGSGTVTVLLGDGNGGFPSSIQYTVGTAPVSIAVGNLNGNPGLAVANFATKNVSLLIGNASGSFSAVCTYTVGNNPSSVTMGDFNGDGVPDIAVANKSDSSVTVLLLKASPPASACPFMATSKGPFYVVQLNPPTPPVAYPSSIVTADFNLDGKLDLAIADEGINAVTVLLGDGTGNFGPTLYSAPIPLLGTGTEPFSLAVGYFNDDPYPDLAVVNLGDSTVTVFQGTGTGTFTSPGATFSVGIQPESVAVGDFNNDGKPDIAITGKGSNIVTILLNGNPGPSTVSAASLKVPVAPGSLITIMGAGLASAGNASMAATLPVVLGGAGVILTDSSGFQTELPLVTTSPTQITAMIPLSVNAGPLFSPIHPNPVILTVYTSSSSGMAMQSGTVPLLPVAPALYSANGTGEGVAMGSFSGNGGTTISLCPVGPFSCVPAPIDLSAGGVLTLSGTGITGNVISSSSSDSTGAAASVGVNFGGQSIGPCLIGSTTPQGSAFMEPYCLVNPAGQQGSSGSMNQVTIVLPPMSIPTGIIVPISVTSAGLTSNVVTIYVQRSPPAM